MGTTGVRGPRGCQPLASVGPTHTQEHRPCSSSPLFPSGPLQTHRCLGHSSSQDRQGWWWQGRDAGAISPLHLSALMFLPHPAQGAGAPETPGCPQGGQRRRKPYPLAQGPLENDAPQPPLCQEAERPRRRKGQLGRDGAEGAGNWDRGGNSDDNSNSNGSRWLTAS